MDKKMHQRKTEYERNLEILANYQELMKRRGISKLVVVPNVGIGKEYGRLNVRGLIKRLLESNHFRNN
jgi:hypothetical protein